MALATGALVTGTRATPLRAEVPVERLAAVLLIVVALQLRRESPRRQRLFLRPFFFAASASWRAWISSSSR